jgi:hypothetical protein
MENNTEQESEQESNTNTTNETPTHIQEVKTIIKRKKHRRGINRTLTDEQILYRKRQQQKENNKKYYIKHLDKIRKTNLQKYYSKRENENKKAIGRPKKY